MASQPQDWKTRVDAMIRSGDAEKVRQGYDAWAPSYDKDHLSFGGILLERFVEMFCRHVPRDAAPILDAGAGTGRLGQALSEHGYGGFMGIDLSPAMLDIARTKPGYSGTRTMKLGDTLDFPDKHFATVASVAAFAPGHAGAEAFAELIRVTKRQGLLILALRAGCEDVTGFDKRRLALERQAHWKLVDEIPDFVSHPDVAPPLRYGVHAYIRTLV